MARVRKEHTASNAGHGQPATTSLARIEFTFINVYFNQLDQQYLVDNWEDAPQIVFDWLTGLPSGYKFSVSLDKTTGRYNATLACSLPDDPNCGLILSVRGASPAAATFGLAYADAIKLEQGWKSGGTTTASLFG